MLVTAARFAVLAGSMFAAAGTLVFVVAGLSHGGSSDVVAALVFGSPACALLLFAARRLLAGRFAPASVGSIAAGMLLVAVIILAGVSASYADPCFEVAHCTRAPTFPFIATTGATVLFILAGMLALLIAPILIGVAATAQRHTSA